MNKLLHSLQNALTIHKELRTASTKQQVVKAHKALIHQLRRYEKDNDMPSDVDWNQPEIQEARDYFLQTDPVERTK